MFGASNETVFCFYSSSWKCMMKFKLGFAHSKKMETKKKIEMKEDGELKNGRWRIEKKWKMKITATGLENGDEGRFWLDKYVGVVMFITFIEV